MDKVVSSAAALGVPGIVLITAMNATGYAGAAALTTALAALGPCGMMGGIAILGVSVIVVKGLSEFGFEAIFKGVVNELVKRGETPQSIAGKIERMPISSSLKCKVQYQLASY